MGFSVCFSLRILVYQCVFPFVFQNKLLEEGQEYAVMMYTWRCCSRALPQVWLITFHRVLVVIQGIYACPFCLNPVTLPIEIIRSSLSPNEVKWELPWKKHFFNFMYHID